MSAIADEYQVHPQIGEQEKADCQSDKDSGCRKH